MSESFEGKLGNSLDYQCVHCMYVCLFIYWVMWGCWSYFY